MRPASGAQTCAAFLATGLDDRTTAAGLHPGAEPMGPGPAQIAGLICSFHGETLGYAAVSEFIRWSVSAEQPEGSIPDSNSAACGAPQPQTGTAEHTGGAGGCQLMPTPRDAPWGTAARRNRSPRPASQLFWPLRGALNGAKTRPDGQKRLLWIRPGKGFRLPGSSTDFQRLRKEPGV